MSIGTAGAIIAGVGTAASIGGTIASGVMQANAASDAADAQAQAEQQVQQLAQLYAPQANDILGQAEGGANASILQGTIGAGDILGRTKQENAALLAPYINGGYSALGQLAQLGSNLPSVPNLTPQQILESDPGYQFRLQQGEQALNRQAAATGSALTGGQEKELLQYNQGLASQAYQQAFNNAQQQYQNQFQNAQQGYQNRFNQLAYLANLGQNANNAAIGSNTTLGTGLAANQYQGNSQIANNQLGVASQQAGNLLAGLGIQGNAITGAADATASGYIGRANAYGGMANGIGSSITQAALLQNLTRPTKLSPWDMGVNPNDPYGGVDPGVLMGL